MRRGGLGHCSHIKVKTCITRYIYTDTQGGLRETNSCCVSWTVSKERTKGLSRGLDPCICTEELRVKTRSFRWSKRPRTFLPLLRTISSFYSPVTYSTPRRGSNCLHFSVIVLRLKRAIKSLCSICRVCSKVLALKLSRHSQR